MDIIRKRIEYPEFTYRPFLQYFENMKWGVCDIETTGLSRAKCACILIGILLPEDGHASFVQYFAETPEEEEDVLMAAASDLQDLDMVVTYNGRSFDMPFIRSRLQYYGEELLPEPYDLDLYAVIKKYSPLKQFMPNLRQKTVEDFLGLWADRTDEINGGDSVSLYFEYVTFPDPELKRQILLHNSDDVLQLYKLLQVLKKTDLHAAMTSQGFPVVSGERRATVQYINVNADALNVRGTQDTAPVNAVDYGDDTGIGYRFSDTDDSFEINIRLLEYKGLKFVDLERMGLDVSAYEQYAEEEDGYLSICSGNDMFCGRLNLLLADILERILKKWTI
jgi:Predicted exonuclease